MDARQLLTFRTVAATRNFTRAAATLGYAQSSVTAQIQALEEELGVPLFERLGRRVTLTDAGVRLLPYAERFLQLDAEARAALAHGEDPAGTLTIGAPESLCTYRLPPVLARFHAAYPRVRLVFRPGTSTEQRQRLLDGTLDVAFVIEGPVRDPGLYAETLIREPLLVLAAPEHPLGSAAAVAPADLAGEPILLSEAGCGYRGLFEGALATAGVRPATTMEFASVEAIKQCVRAGMGLTVLPASTVATEVTDGRLGTLAWSGPELAVETQIVWHKDKHFTPALRAFVEITRDLLGGVTTGP